MFIRGAKGCGESAAVAVWGGSGRMAGATLTRTSGPSGVPQPGNLLEGQAFWSRPGTELELWSWELFLFCRANWSPPPHSGLWEIDTRVKVQGQQSCWRGSCHRNESLILPFSLAVSCLRGELGLQVTLGCWHGGSQCPHLTAGGINSPNQWSHPSPPLITKGRTKGRHIPARLPIRQTSQPKREPRRGWSKGQKISS